MAAQITWNIARQMADEHLRHFAAHAGTVDEMNLCKLAWNIRMSHRTMRDGIGRTLYADVPGFGED